LFVPSLNVGVSVCRVLRPPTTSNDPYCFFLVSLSCDESCFHVYWLNIGNEDGFIASRPFIVGSSSSVVAKIDYSYKEESDVALFCNGALLLNGYDLIPRSRIVQEFASDICIDVRSYQCREASSYGLRTVASQVPREVRAKKEKRKKLPKPKVVVSSLVTTKRLCVRCHAYHKTELRIANCLKNFKPRLPSSVNSSRVGLSGSFPLMNWNKPGLLSSRFN